jgi:RNA polymerase sigma-70 factor (ECF subfamily)
VSDDEPRLIRLAQQGDAAACAALYDLHYDAVYRYCYYHVGDVTLAQDLTSEVFVRMVENLESFDSRGRPLLAWLYTIARNLIADTYRQTGPVSKLMLDEALADHDETPASSTERRLLADRLSSMLKHLTKDQRQVIVLKFLQGHTNAEIARLMGKSEGAIKSLQHRALAALRRALEEENFHEF